MSASLIEQRISIPSVRTRVRGFKGDVGSSRSLTTEPTILHVKEETEDSEVAMLRKVAIAGVAIAMTPLVLLHFVYFFWPELF